MKTIERDELYENVSSFLKSKGIVLSEGSYSQTIQKSCRMLADIINLGQQGLERAKTGIDSKIDQVRQVIHERTAPRGPKTDPMEPKPSAQPPAGSTPTSGIVEGPGTAGAGRKGTPRRKNSKAAKSPPRAQTRNKGKSQSS